MPKSLVLFVFLFSFSALTAQQTMSNDSLIKLSKSGLSDDQIIQIVGSLPANYDLSSNGQLELLKSGVSNRVVSALIAKSSVTPSSEPAKVQSAATIGPSTSARTPSAVQPAAPAVGPVSAPKPPNTAAAIDPTYKPRVFVSSASKGPNRNASRDQSMEMGKDLERNCPSVRITISDQMADYTVLLNHIEAGFVRDNQIQVADKNGDLISRTKEGGSINGGSKKVCDIILQDWAKK